MIYFWSISGNRMWILFQSTYFILKYKFSLRLSAFKTLKQIELTEFLLKKLIVKQVGLFNAIHLYEVENLS